ncbi:hypothetical protein GCK72_007096 [Caenorhabditis remanei]|uniref:NTF2-like domain-containing protein n=1 Tax=Caenorhabditis remanei TaxID=31234 RepID=A0A6A5HKQ0_CAERE|nr:hypothetical protein GCK72_007096 [Caenorhabditis remanei]KAF1767137.1 hypothetical protein GCK72_007096 [Caenorhabditis remanei]
MVARIMNQKVLDDWMEKDNGYVESVKNKLGEEISQNFRWQSSFKDPLWKTALRDPLWKSHVALIYAAQDENMVAEVCNSPFKMNQVQFNMFLHKNRNTFKPIDPNAPYSFNVLNTTKDVLKVVSEFQLTSWWDYNVTMIYNVEFKYQVINKQGSYKIVHIVVGGGCTEHGVVNHEYTDVGVQKEALEALKQENNRHVRALFYIMSPGEMKYLETDYEIPSIWLEALEKDEELLDAGVCNHNEETKLPKYTGQMIKSWYRRLSQMWKPPNRTDTDYVTVQMLSVHDTEMTARITMRLEIGLRENATIHEWNFKIRLSFNKHGDNHWYITKFHALCPATIDYMQESLKHMPELITENFLEEVRGQPPPVYWYSSVDFIQKFSMNGYVEANICEARYAKNLTQIRLTMMHKHFLVNTTLVGYNLIPSSIKFPATESTTFQMDTVTKPPKKDDGWLYSQKWTFHLKWHNRDQFYYIEKLELTCPEILASENISVTPVEDIGQQKHDGTDCTSVQDARDVSVLIQTRQPTDSHHQNHVTTVTALEIITEVYADYDHSNNPGISQSSCNSAM